MMMLRHAVWCLFVGFIHIAQSGKDYYDVLELERDSSQAEIKRAFRKLSLKHHPDKNPGDEDAAERFAQVANAYGVLSDPEKRRLYDAYGEEGVNENQRDGNQDGYDPHDIFSQFFGGGRQRRQPHEPSRGPDVVVPLRVTLAHMYLGKTLYMNVRRQTICPHCRGSGAQHSEDVRTCDACGGTGVKIKTRRLGPGFIQQFQTTCDVCGGKGKIQTSTCHVCGGKKTVFADMEFDVMIERGMPDGFEIDYESYADEHPDHSAGHIRFQLVTVPHALFTRDGDDLWMDMTITLRESLIGFTKTFTHLDGRTVDVTRSKITKPRQIITLKDEGMPKHDYPSEKGKLKIKFKVEFPQVLTDEQRKGFKELFKDLK